MIAGSFVEELEQRVKEAVEARLIEECKRVANRVVDEEIERIVQNMAIKVFKAHEPGFRESSNLYKIEVQLKR